ncbi:hypothetical protein RD792_005773 [Penstemon davidsonii]|uniref:Pectinesterase n=1 Tax=Penstemon davidsonii TaxID=160366 RepID=A0ABR0DEH0_9LAMI|nr:hypothetical protein RD792_005773 [Penstemon davidsonii]
MPVTDVVVVADGTGKSTSISNALRAAPDYSTKIYIIYVKKGVYKEYVNIGKEKSNIMLIGDGIDAMVVSDNRNYVDGWTTQEHYVTVKGQGFIARDITFENTTGLEKQQAVAFMSESDRTILHRCAFKGYQDTLYARDQRQFYRECKITGTVDFIFGDGTVLFQACDILARQALPGDGIDATIVSANCNYVDGRTTYRSGTFYVKGQGLIVRDITIENTAGPAKQQVVAFMSESDAHGAIQPEGWLPWNKSDFALDTLYYGEYMNNGPGVKLGGRVKWPDYHVITNPVQASVFTVAKFIDGDTWLHSTGVKYMGALG